MTSQIQHPGTDAATATHAMPRKVLCVVGTRPEGIKMAPVIRALRAEPWADVRVLSTAQHRHMLDQVLNLFDIKPDIDLDVMQSGQTLAELTARLIQRIDRVLDSEQPDLVVSQGDTTTVLAMALCCFYRAIPFAHVEAGLRTFDRSAPFPEEMNRHVASYLASIHFAPTPWARDNLLKEGVPGSRIHVTGNTVIDALLEQACKDAPPLPVDPDKRLVLVTTHRRENFGEPLVAICEALVEVSCRHPDVAFLLPVHPNPQVAPVVRQLLGQRTQIVLSEPLDYRHFVAALKQSHFVLTDSGGVQEEAPALGKPVLVMRATTERPEAVEAGVARLVGIERKTIADAMDELLSDANAYRSMARGVSPYGDGHAAARIADALKNMMLGSVERHILRGDSAFTAGRDSPLAGGL